MRAALASSVSAEALIAAGAQPQLCAAAAASAMRRLAMASIVAAARGTGNAEVVDEALAARVRQVDLEWFVANPGRHYRVRRPFQYEPHTAIDEPAGRQRYVLAILDPTDTTVVSIPFHALQEPPDDEAFLRKMWDVMKQQTAGKTGTVFIGEEAA